MQILIQPGKCNTSSLPLTSFDFLRKPLAVKCQSFCVPFHCSSRVSFCSKSFRGLKGTHFSFCSRNDVFDGFSSAQSEVGHDSARDNAELGLLNKPFPVPREDSDEEKESDNNEALAPFLKFFGSKDGADEGARESEGEGEVGDSDERAVQEDEEEGAKKVRIQYYDPKPGDFVVGVVVSGNENKLDVNIGADLLGTMLTKEVLPLYDKELDHLLCDPVTDAEEFYAPGRMGIVKYDEAVSGGSVPGQPVVETGTVLFAEVLGRTLSGRPLLSTRRLFRQVAWHRVRQVKQLNEPFEVTITEWNTGGLLSRLEGLRAFIPKAELVKKVSTFGELKEKVGSRLRVLINRINEETNDLILSEKEAWEMLSLREGALLEGTVRKIFPYGAQIRIGQTNRSGLLHISNITRGEFSSVSDLLAVDDEVKVMVVKSLFPDKISLSIADLESEPGLFISDKERVFSEAEMMAKKYRAKLPVVLDSGKSKSPPIDKLGFENEATMYANWKWFKFERGENQTDP